MDDIRCRTWPGFSAAPGGAHGFNQIIRDLSSHVLSSSHRRQHRRGGGFGGGFLRQLSGGDRDGVQAPSVTARDLAKVNAGLRGQMDGLRGQMDELQTSLGRIERLLALKSDE